MISVRDLNPLTVRWSSDGESFLGWVGRLGATPMRWSIRLTLLAIAWLLLALIGVTTDSGNPTAVVFQP